MCDNMESVKIEEIKSANNIGLIKSDCQPLILYENDTLVCHQHFQYDKSDINMVFLTDASMRI